MFEAHYNNYLYAFLLWKFCKTPKKIESHDIKLFTFRLILVSAELTRYNCVHAQFPWAVLLLISSKDSSSNEIKLCNPHFCFVYARLYIFNRHRNYNTFTFFFLRFTIKCGLWRSELVGSIPWKDSINLRNLIGCGHFRSLMSSNAMSLHVRKKSYRFEGKSPQTAMRKNAKSHQYIVYASKS